VFGSLKKFFSVKPKKQEESIDDTSIDSLIGIRHNKPVSDPPLTMKSIVETKKEISNKEKPVYNNEQGVLSMSERYLVVLDTTNRPEVKDRGLQGGLKNFYFVYAVTPDQAREIVLRSFARTPAVLNQIQYSLTVTPLKSIIPLMDERNYFWSYIPLNKGQRAPGQRATPPSQTLNPSNPEEVIPMNPRDIPAPITPPNQNDTPKISEIPAEAKAVDPANPMAAMMSPTLPNGQPNPMFAMMQMMMTAMGQQAAAAPKPPQEPKVYRGDPNSDPELAENMAAVRATAVPRHRHHDPSAVDDAMEAAERRANQQVEQFKTLPREQQVSAGLTDVSMNDVGVDMNSMRRIMEASKIPTSGE
jgi:hypothetical protein